jgi:hypothetical protein
MNVIADVVRDREGQEVRMIVKDNFMIVHGPDWIEIHPEDDDGCWRDKVIVWDDGREAIIRKP